MSKLIVTKPADFLSVARSRPVGSKAPSEKPKRATGKPSARASLPVKPENIVRNLALAVWIERQIDSGEFANYAAAAKRLGVSRARVSQLLKVTALPQELINGLLVSSDR